MKRTLALIFALSMASAAACDDEPVEVDADADSDGDGDGDGDIDADSDGDGDSDTDSDIDADGDTEDDGDVDDVPDRELQLPGLSAPVDLFVNEHGLTHMSCQTDEDCVLALGYVHASRRFFTMDIARRISRGTIATLYGSAPSAIDNDTSMRHYLSTATGELLEEAIWEQLRPETQALFEAYTAGVNAWLDDLRNERNDARLSEEYSSVLLPGAGEPIPDWDALDSVGIWVTALQGNGDSLVEVFLSSTAAVFPPDLWVDMFQPSPVPGSYTIAGADKRRLPLRSPIEGATAARDYLAPLSPLLEQVRDHDERLRHSIELLGLNTGSNNWALGASYSGGNAVHAADPHGPLGNPPYATGYVLDARTRGEGTLHVGGMAFAGQPLIALGFNEDVAWGCTVSYADTTDLYVEELNADGTGVIFGGDEVLFVERTDTIEVAGGEPFTVTHSWVPHHGPVIAFDVASGVAYTRRWTGHGAPLDIEAYLDVMRSSTVEEAMTALEQAEAFGCNVVLADSNGSSGWHLAARIPHRPWASAAPGRAPWLPLPGDGSAEWDGVLSMDEHPRVLNPSAGYVTTANNAFTDAWVDGDPTNDGHPYWQGYLSPGYRQVRIQELLETTRGAHGAAESVDLQADTYTLLGEALAPGFLAAADSSPGALSPEAIDVVNSLRDWSFTCPTGLSGPEPDSPADPETSREAVGCTAFHAALVFVLRATFRDEFETYSDVSEFSVLGTEYPLYRAMTAPEELASGDAIWDDLTTPSVTETRDETFRSGLEEAADYLVTQVGATPTDWQWGRVHTVTLESYLPSPSWNIGPFANDGAMISVDLGLFRFEETGFAHVHGPANRLVVELAPEGPEGFFQLPGGLDLHRDSPYYDNLLPLWLRNEPVVMPFAFDAARDGAVEHVGLLP